MGLGALFARYLADPRATAPALATALEEGGLELEARCCRAWGDHQGELQDGSTPITLGIAPPTNAVPGDRWFDPTDLAVMLHVGRSWLATRPVARWQVQGFCDTATFVPRAVQVEPPYVAFERARLLPQGDELAAATALTNGEATLYGWYFGKCLPSRFDWVSAAEELPNGTIARLWGDSVLEWCAAQPSDDEGARFAVTRENFANDPDDDPTILHGEYTRDRSIGFRTAVVLQLGLLERPASFHALVEPVALTSWVERRSFASLV